MAKASEMREALEYIGVMCCSYNQVRLLQTVVHLNKLKLSHTPVVKEYLRYANDDLARGDTLSAIKNLQRIAEYLILLTEFYDELR